MRARIIFHGVAILVLLTTIAVAQTPVKPAKPAPAGQSADRESSAPSVSEVTMDNKQTTERKSGSVIVLDRDTASGHASGREVSSGMATGRRQYQPVAISKDKSLGPAHATESLASPTQADTGKGGQMENASTNPMYKGNKTEGNNPLYESKEKQAASNPGASHEVVEYKDGEDMTTRYRPGNNKTIKTSTGAAPNQ
jgi:hypothetical protein